MLISGSMHICLPKICGNFSAKRFTMSKISVTSEHKHDLNYIPIIILLYFLDELSDYCLFKKDSHTWAKRKLKLSTKSAVNLKVRVIYRRAGYKQI
jgi:hypothetical protein